MNMIKRILCLVLPITLAFEAKAAESLRFEGATNFTARGLEQSLKQSLDYQVSLAAESASARAGVVERLLLAGYQREGFPDAKVTARADPDDVIVVRIQEGPRYFCGDLVITGSLSDISGEALRLQFFPPKTNDAGARNALNSVTNDTVVTNVSSAAALGFWKQDEGAPFDRWTPQTIQSTVSNAFARLGHFFPKFTFEIRRRTDADKADLVLNVMDEGPAMVIGDIVVQGAVTNTADEIRSFVGLSPGDRFSSVRLEQKRTQLLGTGRLIDAQLIPAPPDAQGRSKLLVRILEVPGALPLRVAPSPAEAVLLRLADWLATWKTNDLDLAIDYENSGEFDLVEKGARVGCVISPRRGFVATLSAPKAAGGQMYGAILGQARGESGLYLPSFQKGLSVTQFTGSLQAFIELKASPPDEKGKWKNSLIGFGAKSTPGPVPVEVNLTVHPAVLADLAYVKGSKITIANGVATFTYPARYMLVVEERTGRLIELRMGDENGSTNRVKVDPGAFDRAVASLKKQSTGWKNMYDPEHPYGSFVSLVAPLLLKLPGVSSSALARVSLPQWKHASDALEKVLEAASSAKWDVLAEGVGSPEERLGIPWGASRTGTPSETGMFGMIATFVLSNLDQIAPDGTWAASCTRAAAFRMCGQSRLFASAMTSIARDPQSGPLALAQCASLASTFDPRFARVAATMALDRNAPADFVRDIGPLVDGNTLFGETALAIAHALAAWSEEDLDAVAALLPAEHAKALRDFVSTLQAAPKQEFNARLLDALAVAWDAGLRSLHDARVRGIRNEINAAALGIPEPRACSQMPPGVVDLGGVYNRPLKAVLSNSPLTSNVVAQLASNVQVIAGHEFDVRGLVLVAPPGLLRDAPSRVEDIRVDRTCKRIHFLHGASTTDRRMNDDENIATYVVHYADGTRTTIDVLSGRDISSSIIGPDDKTTRAGAIDIEDVGNLEKGTRLRLYVQTWENPHPGKTISSIDFTCWHTRAVAFLAGLAAEP